MSLVTLLERSQKERESFRYTDLKPLSLQKFGKPQTQAHVGKLTLPSIETDAGQRHQIVFVNGVFCQDLSHMNELRGLLTGDEKKGYRLSLDSDTCLVTLPIEILYVSDVGSDASEINQKLSIDLGASGRLTLIEHHLTPTSQAPIAALFESEITLGAKAKLVHGKILSGSANLSSFSSTKILIGAGAFYDNFILVEDGKLTRHEIHASLTDKMAQCSLSGLLLLRKKSHADFITKINHQAPFCSSRQIYKSVVDDQAAAAFQGKVLVEQAAQKSDARQLSRALLLSDQAEVNAKPELQIFADDVKCSHGSTVGALDENAYFYLRQRGLNEEEAKGLLIRGFAGELIEEIKVPQWQNYCRSRAELWCDGDA